MRKIAALLALPILALGLGLAGGCGESAIDGHTRPTILSMNEGMPLEADVFVVDTTLAGGGVIPEDGATVRFSNPPSQKFLTLAPEDPYGTFILTGYTVDYDVVQVLPDNAMFSVGTLPTFIGSMNLALPVNSEVETFLILAPASMKYQSPIRDILPGGAVTHGELVVRATITFTGHESSDDREKSLVGAMTILFADFADEN